jgi:hypothetical protein
MVCPVRLSEIANRLNGISTPFFGVSWTPATVDVVIAKKVITYLQGRRLLLSAHEIHDSAFRRIEQSVSEIRAFLTETLCAGGLRAEMEETLDLMRRACLEFLDALERYSDLVEANRGASFRVLPTGAIAPDSSAAEARREEALGDYVAHGILFKSTMRKLAYELAEAHGIDAKGFHPDAREIV